MSVACDEDTPSSQVDVSGRGSGPDVSIAEGFNSDHISPPTSFHADSSGIAVGPRSIGIVKPPAEVTQRESPNLQQQLYFESTQKYATEHKEVGAVPHFLELICREETGTPDSQSSTRRERSTSRIERVEDFSWKGRNKSVPDPTSTAASATQVKQAGNNFVTSSAIKQKSTIIVDENHSFGHIDGSLPSDTVPMVYLLESSQHRKPQVDIPLPNMRTPTLSDRSYSISQLSSRSSLSISSRESGTLSTSTNTSSTSIIQTHSHKRVKSSRNVPHKIKKKVVPQNMQHQWRIGAAPSALLAMSQEDTLIATTISSGLRFHTSRFESTWKHALVIDPHTFDLEGQVEMFRDSTMSVAALMDVNKVETAYAVLDKVFQFVGEMLQKQHPQLYLILAELVLDLTRTSSSGLRDYIKHRLFQLSRSHLGPTHPITNLLSLNSQSLAQSTKNRIGEALHRQIYHILKGTFGPESYQCSTELFCLARVLSGIGQLDEAITIVLHLLHQWEQTYGVNSMIVVYTLIELANMCMVSDGPTIMAECYIFDCLRRIDLVSTTNTAAEGSEDITPEESRHRRANLNYARIGSLRTLGRIQAQRRNYGAALHFYAQAIALGQSTMGDASPVVQLTKSEWEKTKAEETTYAMEALAINRGSRIIGPDVSPIVASPIVA